VTPSAQRPETAAPASPRDVGDAIVSTYLDAQVVLRPGVAEVMPDDRLPVNYSFMTGILVRVDGKDHQERRRVLGAALGRQATERFDRTVRDRLTRSLRQAAADANGDTARADLVQVLRHALIAASAVTMGLDGLDDPANIPTALGIADRFSAGIRGSRHPRSTRPEELAQIVADAAAAQEQLDTMYLTPAWEKRQALVDVLDSGPADKTALPPDLLTQLVRNAHLYSDRGRDVLVREILSLFAGMAFDVIPSILFALDALLDHSDLLKAETDPALLRAIAFESLRLRTNGVVHRRLRSDVELPSGLSLRAGDHVALDVDGINRDPHVYGSDARQVRAGRRLPPGVQPFGFTFSGGEHTCLGRGLVTGSAGAGGHAERPGLLMDVLHTLMDHGVQRDPAHAPTNRQRLTSSVPGSEVAESVEDYVSYPVSFATQRGLTPNGH